MNLKTIAIDDYQKLVPFWKKNYFVNEMDSFNRFKLFLEKNPDLSVLIEENGEILGTALGSFDGRRGYLQKVVTDKDKRKKGIGKQLVDEVLKRLQALGATYIPINVEEDSVTFYEKCGFMKTTQIPMNKNI
jgi:ribosomal protein S18 acetylase RimI-like enzyme